MFWREIIPNIAEYELLTDEMMNYFSHENLFLDFQDENFLRTLKCNEPKAGKDFVVYKATDVNEAENIAAGNDEPLTTVAKKTYTGNFGWDMGHEDDTQSACIKVKFGQRAPEPEPEEDYSLDKVLSIVLTAALHLNVAEQYQQLSMDEMIGLLEDEDDLTELEDLKPLPKGLRKLMTNYTAPHEALDTPEPVAAPRVITRFGAILNMSSSSNASNPFDQPSQVAVTAQRRANRSTINVPDDVTDGFAPLHASSPVQSSGTPNSTPLNDVSNTPQRQGQPRSKPSQERPHNTRMEQWMQTMDAKGKKRPRPRNSTSPEPEAKKVSKE